MAAAPVTDRWHGDTQVQLRGTDVDDRRRANLFVRRRSSRVAPEIRADHLKTQAFYAASFSYAGRMRTFPKLG